MSRNFLHTVLLLAFILLNGSSVVAQDDIKSRQAELIRLRNQIKEFESQITERQRAERSTLEVLDTYDRKGTLLRKLISKLRQEEKELQRSIGGKKSELDGLESQLKFLKEHYAGYVTSTYKAGRTRDLELMLSSASVNQFLVRTTYLRRFSDQRARDAEKIKAKTEDVAEAQAQLSKQLSEERLLIASKSAEEDRLTSLASSRRELLSKIRYDKKIAQREIERRVKAAKELEGLIAKLIEADRLRAEKVTADVREGKLPQPPPTTSNFDTRKGKLRWPVAQGSVVAKFGEHVHPRLKTITHNTGIDIAVKVGTPVSSVFDGEVSTILWYPSYGNLIIINHFSGYRTVYTHLGEITVVEGQKVKEGQTIGTSGDSIEGPRLHFELWKERDKQNPESWLAKQ